MIAITGATGLLGKYIVEKFIAEDQTVIGIKRISSNIDGFPSHRVEWRDSDLLDVISLSEALKGSSVVIHAAACVSFNPKDRDLLHQTNVIGTRNVVDTCLKLGIPKLIYVSSISALGRPKEDRNINEDAKWIDSPLNSAYGISKYQAELEVYRGQEEGLLVSVLNPSVILAPGNWNNSSAQIFKYVWAEKLFYVDGFLNYIDARDVAEMIFRIYKNNISNEKFIASAGNQSIKTFLIEIAKRFDKKPPSVKVAKSIIILGAALEWLRSKLTGSDPLFTRHTARMASETFFYNHAKAKDVLNMQFRTLNETLDWCCAYYVNNNSVK